MMLKTVEGFDAVGLAVRTCNADEMNTNTAKISNLWETFYAKLSANFGENTNIFGVYTNYASDANGDFDVIACADHLAGQPLDALEKISVYSGKYLVFSGKGEIPALVVGLWQDVWDYFDAPDVQYTRAYTTDFEAYHSDTEVSIYIAVK